MAQLERRMDRFSGLDWAEYLINKKQKFYTHLGVDVLGAGGIGSWTSLLLARAGFQVRVIDFDKVEDINAAGQLYGASSIGMNKVDALINIVQEFASEESIYGHNQKVDETYRPDSSIVVSAFDNMAARKISFERWFSSFKGGDIPIFIDGRLLAEQFTIFCVTYDKADEYRKYLFDDSEVPDLHCSIKQTSHIAAMIASYITAFLTNHLSNVIHDSRVKAVPFKFELFTPLNMSSSDD